eukprot:TRINITY_DN327_c1_g2_i2.p1 TRINITY_DN327_c1_g2~~TRINITY_DN327_c1_g2_i2.p1  ORF type:complete len:559 (-),score=224.68 TRINITY_DN327_c1_g2_i2:149-1825(-)
MSLDNSVVRVRAQVMMRDDSTGGWVPMGGGGLSNVSVRKRRISHEDDQPCKHEYLIHGKRHSDQSVVLSCTIKRDFEYNKVMPTFHHWKTGNKKFGLTFQTAADARAFDKGVRLAIEDLLDGMPESSPLHQYNMDGGEDDVFMQLHLPVEKSEGSSQNGRPSLEGGSPSPHPPAAAAAPLSNASSANLFHLLPPPPRLGGLPQQQQQQEEKEHPAPNRIKQQSFIQTDQHNFKKKTMMGLLQQANNNNNNNNNNSNSNSLLKDSSYVKFPYREISQNPEYSSVNNNNSSSLTKSSGVGETQPLYSSSSSELLKKSSSQQKVKKMRQQQQQGVGGHVVVLPTNTSTLEHGGVVSSSSYHPPLSSSPSYVSPPSSSSSLSSSPSLSSSSLSASFSKKNHHLLLPAEKGGGNTAVRPPGASGGPPNYTSSTSSTCDRCRTSFSYESNPVGSCPEAPDVLKKTIEGLSCLSCAKCLLFHCMSSQESESPAGGPCDCSNADGHWARRWISLSLLSVLVPCLCCYLPLMGCYKCGRKCRICGGRHVPANTSAATQRPHHFPAAS